MIHLRYKLKDVWYLPGIIGLIIIFLSKFISFTKLLMNCSILKVTDLASHITCAFFLVKYGYLNIVPEMNGGFRLFEVYPPGWSFFVYPLYYLSHNIEFAAYLSFILIYIGGFVTTFFLGKKVGLSIIQRIAFFIFLFMNPIMIDYLMGGRFPEIFAFTSSVIIFFLIMIYKNKKLDKYSLFLIIPYFVVLISHPYIAPLSSILFFSLFLIKNKKQKIFLIAIILVTVFLSLIWLGPFLNALIHYPPEKRSLTSYQKGELLNLDSLFSFNTIILLLFWSVSYIYFKNKKLTKKDKLFFSPIIILSILIFFRISPFIPILNQIPPNTYNLFYLMISLFIFIKIKYYSSKILRNIIIMSFILLPFLCAVPSLVIREPIHSDCTTTEKDIFSLFQDIDDTYLVFDNKRRNKWLTAYATIYFNLSTPSGIGRDDLGSLEMYKLLIKFDSSIKENNCKEIKNVKEELKVKYLISYNEECERLSKCNFKLYKQKNQACIYI